MELFNLNVTKNSERGDQIFPCRQSRHVNDCRLCLVLMGVDILVASVAWNAGTVGEADWIQSLSALEVFHNEDSKPMSTQSRVIH